MARTPKRLYGPAQLGSTPATKYTTPSVTKTIVRHIHVLNGTGGAVTLTMSIGADAAGTRIFETFSIGASQVLDHFGYYVLEATETIQAYASSASALVLTIDGDEYTLG